MYRSVQISLPALLLAVSVAQAGSEPLRGDYTFGHEVNTFCPEKNSQCYWLGPNSSQAARAQLKQIYQDKKPGLYKPVCVVLEGEIDRDSPRDGFAADYDGLIDVTMVHGACEDLSMILPHDLNHRRWVLVAINGDLVENDPRTMTLDFGERLFLEGRDGCLNFRGFIHLEASRINFTAVDFDDRDCTAEERGISRFVDQSIWQVRIEAGNLVLQSAADHLVFARDDWRG